MKINIIKENLNKNAPTAFFKNNSEKDDTLTQQGTKYLDESKFNEAIECFQKAVIKDEKDTEAYFLMGKAYKLKSDYQNAAINFNKYNSLIKNNAEAKTLEGECYKNLGQYTLAMAKFREALTIEPNSDYTIRNYKQSQNYLLAVYDLKKAEKNIREQSSTILKQAFEMAKNYFPSNFFKNMGDVSITFDKTSMMGGRANIAQYEHSKRKISVTDEFLFSSPEVVGAYLVHEFTHAKDNDAYTSVREEQDAFINAAKFWKDNSKGIKEPEMDYTLELYNNSPQKLEERVEYIYKIRDNEISDTSPNHPPSKSKTKIENASLINNQPIKTYDVIA